MARRGGPGFFAVAAGLDAGEHVFEGVGLGGSLGAVDAGCALDGLDFFGFGARDLREVGLDDVADVLGGLVLVAGGGVAAVVNTLKKDKASQA